MGELLKYPRGSILVMTTGAYSDYHIVGFLVAVADLDLPKLAQQYVGENPKDNDQYEFPTWLVSRGLAMPVENSEIHLGEYGEWAEEFGVREAAE